VALKITINLTETAADLIAGYGAGAKLYLDSSLTEGGAYSAVDNETLVSGTEQYEFWDATGTSSTWYKSRVGNTGGTEFSDYSAAFQATSLRAYATLAELRRVLNLDDNDTGHDAYLTDLLSDVSLDIDGKTGRRFYRSPQVSGTATVYFDTHDHSSSLAFATRGKGTTDGQNLDVISITTLSVRDSETDAYVEVAAGDTGYYLQSGTGPGLAGTDWPYEDIVLSPAGDYGVFPTGYRSVKLVGVLGFPYVPGVVRRATVAEAAERFRQSVSGGAAPQGVNQFGTPVFLTGNSTEMRDLMRPPYSKRVYVA
jgi:hypothetical protein